MRTQTWLTNNLKRAKNKILFYIQIHLLSNIDFIRLHHTTYLWLQNEMKKKENNNKYNQAASRCSNLNTLHAHFVEFCFVCFSFFFEYVGLKVCTLYKRYSTRSICNIKKYTQRTHTYVYLYTYTQIIIEEKRKIIAFLWVQHQKV